MKDKAAFRRLRMCLFLLLCCGTMAGCTEEKAWIDEALQEMQQTAQKPYEESETEEATSVSTEAEMLPDAEQLVRMENMPEIYYAFHTLDESERMLYLELLDILTQRQENITVSTTKPELLGRVFNCVMSDHPELFFVEGYQYTKYTVNQEIISISFLGTYSMEADEIAAARQEIEEAAALCLSGMPKTEDEYSKAKYLYDYLIQQTEYDREAPDNQDIRSVFIGKRSVCQGYAKAFQYLMQQAGMVSALVTGYTQQEGHAWNLVRVNGAYYYVDATWGDASYTFAEEDSGYAGELPPINYDYFLVTTKELCLTHEPDELIRLPECKEEKDNYYVREGLYLQAYDEEQLRAIFGQAYENASGYVMFKCRDEQVFDEISRKLIEEQEVFRFLQNQGTTIAYTDNRLQRTFSFWI